MREKLLDDWSTSPHLGGNPRKPTA